MALDGWDAGRLRRLPLTAWRFKDVTGAYAASLEPAPITHTRVGNYLISCEGKCPKNLAELADASLPTRFARFSAHAERLSAPPEPGPALRAIHYRPGWPARECPANSRGVADFDFSTEVQIARYRTPSGEETLAILSYPTPDLARQQRPLFRNFRTQPRSAPAPGHRRFSRAPTPAVHALEASELPRHCRDERNPSAAGPVAPSDCREYACGDHQPGRCSPGLLRTLGRGLWPMLLVARRFGYSGADGSLITLHLERQITARISPRLETKSTSRANGLNSSFPQISKTNRQPVTSSVVNGLRAIFNVLQFFT